MLESFRMKTIKHGSLLDLKIKGRIIKENQDSTDGRAPYIRPGFP